MSPVDRAGLVSKISPSHYFLCKNSMCSYENWANLVSDRDLGCPGSYEHSSPVDWDEIILTGRCMTEWLLKLID